MNIPLSPCVPENFVSRDEFSCPVPRQPAHLHTQAEPGAYLRDSSRVPRRRPFMKPPYAIGSVPSLSGHAVAYRWRSLPRVRRHRASKLQGSPERVLPWQVTMDQLIFSSVSHTHYWYEVGMLKVPASEEDEPRFSRTNRAFPSRQSTVVSTTPLSDLSSYIRTASNTFCIARVHCTDSRRGKKEVHQKWSIMIPKKGVFVIGSTLKTNSPAPTESR